MSLIKETRCTKEDTDTIRKRKGRATAMDEDMPIMADGAADADTVTGRMASRGDV